MATFYSNTYEGRRLRLEVSQSGGNCNWALYSEGGASNASYNIYKLSISINGSHVYGSGNYNYDTFKFPCMIGSTSGSVWIGNATSAQTISISFTGSVFVNRATQHGGDFTMEQYIFKPSLSSLNVSNVGDKSVYVSFSVTAENGQTPYSPYIDLSLTDFGSAVKS